MKKLSFKIFIEQNLPSLQKDPNFAEYVKIANVLVRKHNKSIFLSDYKTSIQKNNQGLRDFIEFLGKYGFWNKKNLEFLIKKIQEQEWKFNFTLQVPLSSQKDVHKKIDTVLKKDFTEYSLEDDEYSQLGIQIKWNGYQYKRNLDSDLDILLQ